MTSYFGECTHCRRAELSHQQHLLAHSRGGGAEDTWKVLLQKFSRGRHLGTNGVSSLPPTFPPRHLAPVASGTPPHQPQSHPRLPTSGISSPELSRR